MYKKKILILTLVFSLLIPLTVFSVMDERGAFDTRSQAQSQLREEFRVADIDSNSRVDLNDFEGWLEMWKGYKANKSEYTNRGDLDEDGVIGISDYAMWLEQWRGYKAYAANPERYLAQKPEGLVAAWSLDEQTGSRAYLGDKVSGEYDGMPQGAEYMSSGIFGSSHVLSGEDRIDIQNGESLPFGEDDFSVSFWMNLFDNTIFDLGENPDAFVWDEKSQGFSIMPLRGLDYNNEELIAMFEDIDIEAMTYGGDRGWFNMIASYDSENGIMEYYVNENYVGKYNFSNYDDFKNYALLALLPEGSKVGLDNMQAWGGEASQDVKTVYSNSVKTYSTTSNNTSDKEGFVSYSQSANCPEQDSLNQDDPNFNYNVRGYESRQCIYCSTKYKATRVHFNIVGYTSDEYPSESVCKQAYGGTGGYSVQPGSIFYTCALSGCGGLSANYKPEGYPGDSENVSNDGINTMAEYLYCVEKAIDKSILAEPVNSVTKACMACSTRYYLITAHWNGTCNESNDEERLAVDPNLVYKCRRCGTPDNPDKPCILGGYPSPDDKIFQLHYDASYNAQWGSAYDIYMKTCLDDRPGCSSPIVNTSKNGACSRCSNQYLYAYANDWDPGPDGVCYLEMKNTTYPNDDLYNTAKYTCDCGCLANNLEFNLNSQWIDTTYQTYDECKTYCDYQQTNPARLVK
jgi:hypothetical protein